MALKVKQLAADPCNILLRRVGPERAGHFGLRAQVEVTAARKALSFHRLG
jgi:hypothetical protein